MKLQLFRIADKLYYHAYPIYYPLYSSWKALRDRRERTLLRTIIRTGMCVVDGGANIGVYTRFLSALAGDSGHVHSFEPAPYNFKRLQQNVGKLPNVSLNQCALGETSGSVGLYYSKDLNVDHRTYESGDGRERISVPVTSLDNYFPAGKRVDLIKLDVQGYELSVLRGAERVLKENRDIKVLMEFWPYGLRKASIDPGDVLKFAHLHDFVVTPIPASTPLIEANALATFDEFCNILLTRP